jgi:hypothetical protein
MTPQFSAQPTDQEITRARIFAEPLLGVFAKHVVHPERSGKNGVTTQPFHSEVTPDEVSS